MLLKLITALIFLLVTNTLAFAQKDTLMVKQGDRLVGELIRLDQNTLTFKTPYSSDPISVNWNDVVFLVSAKKFKIADVKGKIMVGSLRLDTTAKSSVIAIYSGKDTLKLKRTELLAINKFDKSITDHWKINTDLGIILTKANNSDQASFDLNVKYFAKFWEFGFDYFGYASTVDTIQTERANLSLSARYNFPENWFLIMSIGSFKSTEQAIDSRVNYFLGSGKYILRHKKIVLWGYAGATYNKEKFTNNPQTFKTAEAFGGLHLEAAIIEKVSINSDLVLYPSLSESGRLRVFSKTDAIVTLAKHFRFGLGYVYNTDNKPPVNSSKTDYLLNAKIGWML